MKQIDINSQGQYPANVLSNLHCKPFMMDDEWFGSIEGLLQGCRIKHVIDQRQAFRLHGIAAKRIGAKYPIGKNQIMYYRGVKFNRHSEFYSKLLHRAFEKCFAQNDTFKDALAECKDFELIHSIGKTDPTDTILTNDEFIGILNMLREKYKTTLNERYAYLKQV